MRRTIHAVISLACQTGTAGSEETTSANALAAVKWATVFVKVESKGLSFRGSGFVIQAAGDSALLVTTRHAIEPKVQVEAPPPRTSRLAGGRHPLPHRLSPRSGALILREEHVQPPQGQPAHHRLGDPPGHAAGSRPRG
jgi:hypothetical protein